MKSRIPFLPGIAIITALGLATVPAAALELIDPNGAGLTLPAPVENPAAVSHLIEKPRIQIAILLDTSNSMDGLIDQTRNQLWQVVNEFSTARHNGETPILEIALFEYGNSGNPSSAGFVRKLNGFTRELDAVSEGLFSLTTNGGSEFCGYAIDTALRELQWSRAANDIRTIFIAGNESFAQGPIPYQSVVQRAQQQGIAVSTIFAGAHQQGIDDQWQAGALLAGGDYLSIDADQQIVHVVAPQDARIAELNAKLNATYLPYGSEGTAKAERQLAQDSMSSDISVGLLSKRARSKASSFYDNSDWDLVDALREGQVSAEEVEAMQAEALPEPMREQPAEQRIEYLEKMQAERDAIQQEIVDLGKSRDRYVKEKQREQAAAAPSISDAFSGAIRRQAEQKNYSFAN